ncbi:MAG: hypothetical protein KDA41_03920, partial [Planctomycetales bacterium]|nr:hypothetical protein [Planctomycetales bacterium]
LVFSLDLKDGAPLAGAGWNDASPLEIAETAWQCGLRQVIVLDLACVGTGAGVGGSELLAACAARWPDGQWIGGGGARSLADVQRLVQRGAARVLVASALHDGRISPGDLDG